VTAVPGKLNMKSAMTTREAAKAKTAAKVPSTKKTVSSKRAVPKPVARAVVEKAARAGRPAVTPMREQVIAFKREQILTEAVELFYELGYQRTTLEMVAERLGMTKPFIYYHFKDKAEILFEISKRGISRGNEVLHQALDASGSPSARLHGAIRDIVKTILNSQRYTAIFFREQKNFDSDIRAPLENMHREFDDLLAALLQQGVKKGEFRIEDIRLCSLAIGGMLNWSYTWYRDSGRLSVADICEGMAAMVMQLVGAPRSHWAA